MCGSLRFRTEISSFIKQKIDLELISTRTQTGSRTISWIASSKQKKHSIVFNTAVAILASINSCALVYKLCRRQKPRGSTSLKPRRRWRCCPIRGRRRRDSSRRLSSWRGSSWRPNSKMNSTSSITESQICVSSHILLWYIYIIMICIITWVWCEIKHWLFRTGGDKFDAS